MTTTMRSGVAVLLMAVMLAACGGDDPESSRPSATPDLGEIGQTSEGDTGEVAATVNGAEITVADVKVTALWASLSEEDALDQLIDSELVFQEAERRGLVPSDEEVRALVASNQAAVLEAVAADDADPELVALYEDLKGTPYDFDTYTESEFVFEAFRRSSARGYLADDVIFSLPADEQPDPDGYAAFMEDFEAELRADAEIVIF